MASYKFLQSQHIDCLMGGEFRFGRLRYYQLLEAVTQDQWIGDKDEGLGVSVIDDVTLRASDGQDAIRSRLADAGISVDANAGLTIRGAVVRNQSDCFIFSASRGELSRLTQSMCSSDRPDYAYDACVRISSLRCLADAIWREGLLSHSGQRVSEAFEPPITDRVAYSSNITNLDISTSHVRQGSPFVKSRIYSEQSEVRIALVPRQTIDRDYVIISAAVAARFLSRQFFTDASCPKPSPSRTSAQILEDLRGVVSEAEKKLQEVNCITLEILRSRERLKAYTEDVSHKEEEIRLAYESKIVRLYWELRQTDERYRDDRMDTRILLGTFGTPHLYILPVVDWYLRKHHSY